MSELLSICVKSYHVFPVLTATKMLFETLFIIQATFAMEEIRTRDVYNPSWPLRVYPTNERQSRDEL